MSDAKLSVISSEPGPWAQKSDVDARDTLERLLTEFDRFVVIGIRRTARAELEWTYSAGARVHPSTSAPELTGSMHIITRQLESELAGDDET